MSRGWFRRLWTALLHLVAVVLLAIRDPPPYNPPSAVPGGGRWLQSAIDQARPGDVITLAAGKTYVGHFVLPRRAEAGGEPIIIRTEGPDAVSANERMSPSNAMQLAKLKSPDRRPVLQALAGARGWRLELLECLGTLEGRGEIVQLGSPQQNVDSMPSDLVLDRLYVHGEPGEEQRRGIALNSRRTVISNSYIGDIKARRADSQAIAGWNGAGRYRIENNVLEAAGENLMFGGADPSISGLVPTDIVIVRNQLSKPDGWRASGLWMVKNLLELKNARDVTIGDNLFETNWAAGQSGYSVLFTPRNQDGRCPWCVVERVVFERNVLRNVAAGISIAGTDTTRPSGDTHAIRIRNNLIAGQSGAVFGGDGFFVQLVDSPHDIVIDHNTLLHHGAGGIVKIEGRVDGFVFTNNLVAPTAYGIIATDHAPGLDTIRATLPGAVVRGNVLADVSPSAYPDGNAISTWFLLAAQLDATAKYQLRDDAPLRSVSLDGVAPGAKLDGEGAQLAAVSSHAR